MTLATVRTAIKTALEVDTVGIPVYDYAPGALHPPVAIVGFPDAFNPHQTLDGLAGYSIPVRVLVRYAANTAAEDALEALIEPIIDAIEAADDGWSCNTVRNFGVLGEQDSPFALGCEIVVDVL